LHLFGINKDEQHEKKSIQMYEEREKFNVLAFFKLYILLSSIRIFIVHKILLLLKNTRKYFLRISLFPVMVYS